MKYLTVSCICLIWIVGILHMQSQSLYGEVSMAELSELENPYFPNTNATFLLKKVDLDFGKKLVIHERIKIYNSEGFEYSDYVIPFEKPFGIKATTYNLEDGKVVTTNFEKKNLLKEEISEGFFINKIAFPNVKVGSIIEIKYEVSYISAYRIFTQDFVPIRYLQVNIRRPTYGKLDIQQNPFVELPIKVLRDPAITTVTGSNIPALKNERMVSNIDNHRGQLIIELYSPSDITDTWTRVCYYLNKMEWFGEQLEKNNLKYFRKELKKSIQGIEDSLEIVKKIDRYLKDRIQWNNYYSTGSESIRQAYKDKAGSKGDINLMLTAMLQSLGFKAHPMLVSSKGKGWVLYPRIKSFNSLLCAVWVEEELYLLDASLKYASFSQIPLSHANGNGLIVYDNNGSLLYPTFITKKSAKNYIIQANLEASELSFKGKTRKQLTYYYAKNFRESNKDKKEDYSSERVEDTDFLRIFNTEVKDIANPELPIMMSYEFQYDSGIEVIGDEIFVNPLLYLSLDENPFIENERLYPIDFEYPYVTNIKINLQLPSDYEVLELPEERYFVLRDGIGSLHFNVLSKANTIQVSLDLKINKQLVDPEYYDGIKQLFVELTNISKSRIVLSKKQ